MDIPDGVESCVLFVEPPYFNMYKARTKSADVRVGMPLLCFSGDKVGITKMGSMKLTFTARFGEFHRLGQVH